MDAPYKGLAKVELIQGVYVFSDSRPTNSYEYLGSVATSGGFWGHYIEVRNKLIKKAKRNFPQGNGLILYPQFFGKDRADVIRFTE